MALIYRRPKLSMRNARDISNVQWHTIAGRVQRRSFFNLPHFNTRRSFHISYATLTPPSPKQSQTQSPPEQFSPPNAQAAAKRVLDVLRTSRDTGIADGSLSRGSSWGAPLSSEETVLEPEPVCLKVEGDPAYEHLEFAKGHVFDAITRECVTDQTKLVTLYRPGDNALVRNMAYLGSPEIECQIESDGGKRHPSNESSTYRLCVVFKDLYTAPVLRIKCSFLRSENREPSLLNLAVDFHFNSRTPDDNTAIRNFRVQHNKIRFSAGGVARSGFNLIDKFSTAFNSEEHQLIRLLQSYTVSGQLHDINLLCREESVSYHNWDQIEEITARLPGGDGKLFPSIGGMDYSAFGANSDGRVAAGDHGPLLHSPYKLLSAEAPLPMVPLRAEMTFASIREAAIQLSYSAQISHEEENQALRLWSEGDPAFKGRHKKLGRESKVVHYAEFNFDHDFPIMALRFGRFKLLAGLTKEDKGEASFRLPKYLYCHFTLSRALPQVKKGKIILDAISVIEGFLMESTSQYPVDWDPTQRQPDAVFRIVSHSNEEMVGRSYGPAASRLTVFCNPHMSSFTYHSQLITVRGLQKPENGRWWPILLNQKYDELGYVDPAADVSSATRVAAKNRLLAWKKWNAEQVQVIEGVNNLFSGLSIVSGPAATGKSLLQRGIAKYFYDLGFHVLALAPANANVDKLARDLAVNENEPGWEDFHFNRLFPGSRDVSVEDMTLKQAKHRKAGHHRKDVLPFRELLNELETDHTTKPVHQRYGIVESVIRAAEERSLSLFRDSKDGSTVISKETDTWDILRELIAEYRKNRLDSREVKEGDMRKYRLAYKLCKGQIVGMNRFMITTTGNVRSSEMNESWFKSDWAYNPPRKGVVVLVDEAAKDVEVNIWTGIVHEQWAEHVKGVFLFGDDKQLQPTNTSAKGAVQFNYFSDRLDIALPTRLEKEGFPCYHLAEQRRMHEVIMAFPNRTVYQGQLRAGPGMDAPLDQQMFGLRSVLSSILDGCISSLDEKKNSESLVRDRDLRRRYIQVSGLRKRVDDGVSLIVEEHVEVFMQKIFPPLFEYFRRTGRKMREEVMIICAYGAARKMYNARLWEFLRAAKCTVDNIPRVMTVDSSQGDESFMVFFDASAQNGKAVGFMHEQPRFNVAITRAKGVFWMIGGELEWKCDWKNPPNLMTRYKIELGKAGQVHKLEVDGSLKDKKDERGFGAGKLAHRGQVQGVGKLSAVCSPS